MDFSGLRCGMILDFLVMPHSKGIQAGNHLVAKMLFDLYEKKCDMVSALCLNHTFESQILKRLKFFKCPSFLKPQPFPMIAKTIVDTCDQETNILDINKWLIGIGDYDAA